MLEVQKFLQNKTLEDLTLEFGINITYRDDAKLLILNYDQIESKQKTHPIVRECRGLILENIPPYNIVVKSFDRFFNYGEYQEEHNKFNWNDALFFDKIDGSYAVIYYYDDKWNFSTRGSFGTGKVSDLSYKSWFDLFTGTINWNKVDELNKNYNYIFELCSLLNMVVTPHKEDTAYLLAIFNKFGDKLIDDNYYNDVADLLNAKLPTKHYFENIDHLLKHIENKPYEYEGIVAYDGDIRMKIKNPLYVAVHHARNNINSISSLVKLILAGETDEFCTYFPNFKDKLLEYEKFINDAKENITNVWDASKHIENQKEFALKIQGFKYKSLLFLAKKCNKHPLDFKENLEKMLIDNLKDKTYYGPLHSY